MWKAWIRANIFQVGLPWPDNLMDLTKLALDVLEHTAVRIIHFTHNWNSTTTRPKRILHFQYNDGSMISWMSLHEGRWLFVGLIQGCLGVWDISEPQKAMRRWNTPGTWVGLGLIHPHGEEEVWLAVSLR